MRAVAGLGHCQAPCLVSLFSAILEGNCRHVVALEWGERAGKSKERGDFAQAAAYRLSTRETRVARLFITSDDH
jgi:hypothetical protein